MRIKIPEFETKKDLYWYLINNKSKLIDQKKSLPIEADAVSFGSAMVHSKFDSFKSNTPVDENVDTLRVKVVANTSNFIDSHFDMILPNAPLKSIQERKEFIPHLNSHIHTLDAKLGEVVDIYLADLSLSELGLNKMGTAQAVIFITDIIKSYNEKVFNQYKRGKVNQHSIGLQYISLDLAINDPDSEKEMGYWNKYYSQVINKEKADEYGFFWVVPEYKLLENSAVLFGSNVLTPTLDNNMKFEPEASTQKQAVPLENTQRLKALEELLTKF